MNMKLNKTLTLLIFSVLLSALSVSALTAYTTFSNGRSDMLPSFDNSITRQYFNLNATNGDPDNLLISPLGDTSQSQRQLIITEQAGIIYVYDNSMTLVSSIVAGTHTNRFSISNWDSNSDKKYLFGIFKVTGRDYFKVFGYNNSNDQLFLERSVLIENITTQVDSHYTDIGCSSSFTSGNVNDLTSMPLCIFGIGNKTWGFNFTTQNSTSNNYFNHQYPSASFGQESYGADEVNFGAWLGNPALVIIDNIGARILNISGNTLYNDSASGLIAMADFDRPFQTDASGYMIEFLHGSSVQVRTVSQGGSIIHTYSSGCGTLFGGHICRVTGALIDVTGSTRPEAIVVIANDGDTTQTKAQIVNTDTGNALSILFGLVTQTANFPTAIISGNLDQDNGMFIFKDASTETSSTNPQLGFVFRNGMYDWGENLIVNFTASGFGDRVIASSSDTSDYYSLFTADSNFVGMIQSSYTNQPPHIVNSFVSVANPICVGTRENFTVDYTDAENDQIQMDVLCDGTANTETGWSNFSYSPIRSCQYNSTGNFQTKIYITDASRTQQLTTSVTRQITVASTNCYNESNAGVNAQTSFGLGQNTSEGFNDFGINASQFQSQGNGTNGYTSTSFDFGVCSEFSILWLGLCPFWYWVKVGANKVITFIFGAFFLFAGILLISVLYKFWRMKVH